ncbi:hypothetical protein [Cellulomonas wangsupingiae]|uniref:HIRAN domain-containing protein n=1 Tax=Cellulomonas wangsupingiae TaxID=2968085 RepID=A0ABY5K062_9CELL|nr:hypothetical protein [Cellulomonas wangsupingiae]MCC2336684.1 hypothetical protein [Cellulomonas wangsupingiae]UUI63826.1 hypothetical protein NP075_11830 [Cellulomonas wangsupingiae]
MPLFRRRPEVSADVLVGFCAAEAPAMQRSLLAALGLGEHPAPTVVPARLQVDRGADDRLVLVWRNVIVGFVPAHAAPDLAVRLDAAGDATLMVRGAVHRADGTWRVWVGDVPPDGFPPVPEGLDTLPPPEPSILGVPLRRLDGHA